MLKIDISFGGKKMTNENLMREYAGTDRPSLVVFLLIDTSKSMEGNRIGSVNDAMYSILPELREISDSNPDAEIKLAVMTFSSGCEWKTETPMSLDKYEWSELNADGVTDLGAACRELESKLHRNTFLTSKGGHFAPVVILITDGVPTDDYVGGLKVLKKNSWFDRAIKVALGVADAKMGTLLQFTDNIESAILLENHALLKKLIHFIVIKSSEIGSSEEAATKDAAKERQEELNDALKDKMEEMLDGNPEDENVWAGGDD